MDDTKLKQIAELRKKVTDLDVDVIDLRSEMEQTEEGIKFLESLDAYKEAKDKLNELTDQYKAECVELYNKTQDKDQLGGAIKMFTTIEVNEDDVIAYAIKHRLPYLVKANISAFKKMAKGVPYSHLHYFIEEVETPKMTLATDLSKFLEDGNDG